MKYWKSISENMSENLTKVNLKVKLFTRKEILNMLNPFISF